MHQLTSINLILQQFADKNSSSFVACQRSLAHPWAGEAFFIITHFYHEQKKS